jgi:hypothetical protein
LDWDNEFDEMIHGTDRTGSILDEGSGAGLDPMDISDPASAYLLLSDDAQDEVTGTGKKRMKCCSCGHTRDGCQAYTVDREPQKQIGKIVSE